MRFTPRLTGRPIRSGAPLGRGLLLLSVLLIGNLLDFALRFSRMGLDSTGQQTFTVLVQGVVSVLLAGLIVLLCMARIRAWALAAPVPAESLQRIG